MSLAQEHTNRTKRHFQTFDALRFFACFKVFIHHLPIVAFPLFVVLKAGGGIGVQFFFVLSGFLITYIILEEKLQTGNLNLKHFFLRRVLRIWPLYYLAISIAFITPVLLALVNLNSSAAGYKPEWLLSLLFLENYKMILTHNIPNISPLGVMWSLCVEEHFYILWGLLLCVLPVKRVWGLILACVVLSPLCRRVYIDHHWATIDLFTNIDLFAYGAIPALLLISHGAAFENAVERIPILAKRLFVFMLLVVMVWFSQPHTEPWDIITTSVNGAIFCLLIVFTIPSATRFKIADTHMLSRLGVYTYGFYIYHTLVINFLLRVFEKYGMAINNALYAVVFATIAFVISIAISVASYHLFEKQFLKLKKFFR